MAPKNQPYAARAKQHKNHLAKQLLELMERKQTNLALSIDVVHSKDLLSIVDRAGPYICIVKVHADSNEYGLRKNCLELTRLTQTHIDIVEDFTQDLIENLETLSKKHDFLIFGVC